MTQLFNLDEIREIVSDTGDVPTLTDEALRVILNSCQADVDFACGGVNSIGAEFDTTEVLEILVERRGEFLNTKAGNAGAITQLHFRYTDGFNNYGLLRVEAYSSTFISDLSHHERSSYILWNGDLYEFTAMDGQVISPDQFQYSHVGVAAEFAYKPLEDMVDGDTAGFVVAGPNAYIKATAGHLQEVKKQAIVELMTLRMNYDALQSMRDGTYSRVSRDYGKERKRILSWVQERLL